MCLKCGKNRDEKFYTSQRGKVCSYCRKAQRRRATKNTRLQLTYGLTHEDYDRLLEFQGSVCAICLGKRPVLSVDHCHRLERGGVAPRETVRGLLCRRCNGRLLTAALDSPEILRRAADYLEDPPAPHVLSSL